MPPPVAAWHEHVVDPLTLARGLVMLTLSGFVAKAGVAPARTPVWVVQIACPAPDAVRAPGERPPSWTVPDGGRRPLFFATLADVRF